MKQSAYNYTTALSGGTTLFFNFYTLALIALGPDEATLARKILAAPDPSFKRKKDSELRRLLMDKGFIIDEGVDELTLLKAAHFKSQMQRGHLGLTIAPTIACNFRCVYCYQDKKKVEMDREVEEALIGFVRQNVFKDGSLSITWYGGEPLLCLDKIERLSKAFQDICEEQNAQYKASIISNGYLLNAHTVEKLSQMKVEVAQITLDGPPEIHNQRRPLAGGGETFETIIANIVKAASKMRIEIRMNVDERNRARIPDLIEVLEQNALNGKAAFYLGQTYPYTDICRDVAGWCLSNEDFTLLGLETALETTKRGLGGIGMIRSRNDWCMADRGNTLAVTPSGGMVKCWNDMANPDAEVGHLLKPATEQMKKNAESWRQRDPFALACAQCLLLPDCMGGCPYLYKQTGELACHHWKHHLRESLCFYYYLKKREQESEIIQNFEEVLEALKENHNAQ